MEKRYVWFDNTKSLQSGIRFKIAREVIGNRDPNIYIRLPGDLVLATIAIKSDLFRELFL